MPETSHDAVLRVADTSGRLGNLITRKWADGRRTISKAEHDEAARLIEQAEQRVDEAALQGGDVLAEVWMADDETVSRVEWDENTVDPQGEN